MGEEAAAAAKKVYSACAASAPQTKHSNNPVHIYIPASIGTEITIKIKFALPAKLQINIHFHNSRYVVSSRVAVAGGGNNARRVFGVDLFIFSGKQHFRTNYDWIIEVVIAVRKERERKSARKKHNRTHTKLKVKPKMDKVFHFCQSLNLIGQQTFRTYTPPPPPSTPIGAQNRTQPAQKKWLWFRSLALSVQEGCGVSFGNFENLCFRHKHYAKSCIL